MNLINIQDLYREIYQEARESIKNNNDLQKVEFKRILTIIVESAFDERNPIRTIQKNNTVQ